MFNLTANLPFKKVTFQEPTPPTQQLSSPEILLPGRPYRFEGPALSKAFSWLSLVKMCSLNQLQEKSKRLISPKQTKSSHRITTKKFKRRDMKSKQSDDVYQYLDHQLTDEINNQMVQLVGTAKKIKEIKTQKFIFQMQQKRIKEKNKIKPQLEIRTILAKRGLKTTLI